MDQWACNMEEWSSGMDQWARNMDEWSSGMDQWARDIEQEPCGMEQESRDIKQEVRDIEQETRDIEHESRAIKQEVRDIEQETRAIKQESRDIEPGSRGEEHKSRGIEQTSRDREQSSLDVEYESRGIEPESRDWKSHDLKQELRDHVFCELCSIDEYTAATNLIQPPIVGKTYLKLLVQMVNVYQGRDWKSCHRQCDMMLDITWEKLNTGYWKDVNMSWRYAYTFISITKAFCEYHLLKTNNETNTEIKDVVKSESDTKFEFKDVVKTCDMGLLMGAPIINNLLSRMVEHFRLEFQRKNPNSTSMNLNRKNIHSEGESVSSVKRQCIDKTALNVAPEFPKISPRNAIRREVLPSIESFRTEFMSKNEPVIIENSMCHWPALNERKWDLEYLKRIAGCRTVPVELGSKYTDDDWSQKLMLMSEFIDKYVANVNSDSENVNTSPGHSNMNSDCGNVNTSPGLANRNPGYLAQHQLFEQIPELERDISIPTYCCLSDLDEDVDINAWFGPKGTVSPLHYDPKHNFLCQVVGYKYIKLYSYDDSKYVYPHEGKMLCNTSQVDVENPDLVKFPEFTQAKCQECLLAPGKMLYIPPKYWHYVRSLSVSFSVSFWW